MRNFNQALFGANLQALLHRYPEDRARFSITPNDEFFKGCEIRDGQKGLELFEDTQLVESLGQLPTLTLEGHNHPPRIVVVEGFGLGSTFQELTKDRRPEVEDIFVIEPSLKKFVIAMGTQDLRAAFLEPKNSWIIGLDQAPAFYRVYMLLRDQNRTSRISSRVYIRHPSLKSSEVQYFDQIERDWENNISTVHNFWGSSDDAIRGLTNTLDNLKFIEDHPGIELLKDAFKGRPAVIISTGPSLVKSIESLRRAQDHCVLIAADASLEVLIKHGITPHFVATLERQETERFFEKIKFPNGARRPHLVACPLTPKKALDLYTGPQWVTYREYDYYGFFSGQMRKGSIMMGHSVSHMCYGLAIHLGCNRVALVGQDLAYDPTSLASHPDGVSYEEWSKPATEEQLLAALKERGEEFYWVRGNLTERVPTSSIYIVYLQEFLDLARVTPDVVLTNCTEGGARMGDLPYESFDQFLAREKDPIEVFQRLQDIYQSYTPTTKLDIAPIKTYLLQARGFLSAGLNVARSVEALDRIHDLRHLQTQLKQDRPFFAFVVHQMARATAELEDEWNKIPDGDKTQNAKRLNILTRWFETSDEVARRVADLVHPT